MELITEAWVYWHNRKQPVNFKGDIINLMEVMAEVLQGFISGPLLFLIYKNDLSVSCEAKDICLFVEDASFLNATFTRQKNGTATGYFSTCQMDDQDPELKWSRQKLLDMVL